MHLSSRIWNIKSINSLIADLQKLIKWQKAISAGLLYEEFMESQTTLKLFLSVFELSAEMNKKYLPKFANGVRCSFGSNAKLIEIVTETSL